MSYPIEVQKQRQERQRQFNSINSKIEELIESNKNITPNVDIKELTPSDEVDSEFFQDDLQYQEMYHEVTGDTVLCEYKDDKVVVIGIYKDVTTYCFENSAYITGQKGMLSLQEGEAVPFGDKTLKGFLKYLDMDIFTADIDPNLFNLDVDYYLMNMYYQ